MNYENFKHAVPGKWNGTENVTYTVFLGNLHTVSDPPMHWQNAFAGEERQIVAVIYPGEPPFYLDNGNGSGIFKMHGGGNPRSYHASVSGFDFIRELSPDEWNQYDPMQLALDQYISDQWAEKHYPEEHKKMQALKASLKKMQSGDFSEVMKRTEPIAEIKKKVIDKADPTSYRRFGGSNWNKPKKKRRK